MAHSLSAKKRIRQNDAARARNRWRKKVMRDAVKDLREFLLHGTTQQCEDQFKKVCSIVDRTAQRGVIHKNTAARYKSRLSARVKAKKQAA